MYYYFKLIVSKENTFVIRRTDFKNIHYIYLKMLNNLAL